MESVRTDVSQNISGKRKVVTNIATFLIARGVNRSMDMEKYAKAVMPGFIYHKVGASLVVLIAKVGHYDVIRKQEFVWMVARVEDMATNVTLSVPINIVLHLSVMSKTVLRVKNHRLPLLSARSVELSIMLRKASAYLVVKTAVSMNLFVAGFLVNVIMTDAEKDGRVQGAIKKM
jgi:hypothetical protein